MKIQYFLTLSGTALVLSFAPQLIAQTIPGPQPTICTRACWSARAPNGTCGSISGLNRVIIHHTASASHWNTTSQATSAANVRGLQNHDMDVQGFCDIEYHWMIDKFGHIFEARYGSMTGLYRAYHDACNNNSHGISFMAYFHPPYNHVPSQTMLNQMYDLIAWRMPPGWSPYGTASYCYGSIGVIDGHRNVVATACPGDGFYPLIGNDRNGGTVRNAIAARRTGATPPPPPLRAQATGQRIRGDFNGDGKEDVVVAYDYLGATTGLLVFTSTGTAFNTPVSWYMSGTGGWDPARSQWVAGDFNNDGLTDVGCLYNYGNNNSKLLVFLSTGSAFTAQPVWWSSTPGGWDATRSKLVAGDFNADGRHDIAIAYDYLGSTTGLLVFTSTGAAFNSPVSWYMSSTGGWAWANSQWVTGDLNNDGMTDVGCLYNYGNNNSKLLVFLSTGSAFTAQPVWWSSSAGGWDATRSKLVAGDFNGDAKRDIAIAYDYLGSTTGLLVFTSTGAAFNPPVSWYMSGTGGWAWANSQWVASDLNNDGKSDVSCLYNYGNNNSKLLVFLSTGAAFTSQPAWWSSSAGGWDWSRSTAF